jgi:hypothetical protein
VRATIILIGLAVSAMLAGSSGAAGSFNPADYTSRVDNPWYPLTPGATYIYIGMKDGKPGRDVLRVTNRTMKIAGVPCAAVDDRLYLNGRLHERTTDWYTQDKKGNVWYFGEDTAELDKHGNVTSTEGTWKAGVKGAEPGIFMPVDPQVGRSFRQEYYKGHAEDHFQIIGLFNTLTQAAEANTLLTKEWTPLEPKGLDHKLYVRGIGMVLEQAVRGGTEHFHLISLRRGS